jgi:hypothetical protein
VERQARQQHAGPFGTGLPERVACNGNRELLDLFEVAEDPATGKAAVVYSDTTRATWTGSDGVVHQLPEIVLAYEK